MQAASMHRHMCAPHPTLPSHSLPPFSLQHVDDKRHLLRLWLSPEDARPLPNYFAELWGSVTVRE